MLVAGGFSDTFSTSSFGEEFYEALLFMKQIFTKHVLCRGSVLVALLRIPEESGKVGRYPCAIMWPMWRRGKGMIAKGPSGSGNSEEV